MLKNEEFLTIEAALRPISWDDYVGQGKIKQNLKIILEAAKKRGESCDHLLFYGQAGLGKTTLAFLIAKQLGANLKVTSGPTVEKMGDLAAILSNLEAGDILFIDEAHRLNKSIEEVLYPAMESRKLHLVIGKGPGARTVSLDLPPFTMIAATTRVHLLSGPLRSRFGASFKLDFYDQEDIKAIIRRSAKILNMNLAEDGVVMLADAARSTPRVANRLLKRVRDYAEVHNIKDVKKDVVQKTLDLLEVDSRGLEPMDRRLLEIIVKKFNGGPVGINALAAALNDDVYNIEEVVEPYLLSIGFLARTHSGRMATMDAYRHLNIQPPQESLI